MLPKYGGSLFSSFGVLGGLRGLRGSLRVLGILGVFVFKTPVKVLITVFDAILTGGQSGQKLQCSVWESDSK